MEFKKAENVAERSSRESSGPLYCSAGEENGLVGLHLRTSSARHPSPPEAEYSTHQLRLFDPSKNDNYRQILRNSWIYPLWRPAFTIGTMLMPAIIKPVTPSTAPLDVIHPPANDQMRRLAFRVENRTVRMMTASIACPMSSSPVRK
ncbi:uncharacterized protein H6S33_008195 [Morchella sextelata]|uniref:uncharacterized protein n=1 Tax=Morchella sextelata TaxID=1174677 RepID=UPI001D052C1C|nr:uncharacterized protein H6S33_008195 [Morchella sextelata]KAH0603191.1 hypothetical protein H6S33_008195 [Morchella sextelata]